MNQISAAVTIQRRNILAGVMVLMMGILGLRFFQYQILKHSTYKRYAENNSIRSIRLPAPRGIFLDRNGKFLVTNSPYYSLAVIPAEVQDSYQKIANMGDILGIDGEEIVSKITEVKSVYDRFQPVVLYDGLSFSQLSRIEEHRLDFPGIFFIDKTVRHYPSRARASHVIGYLRILSSEGMLAFKDRGYRQGELIGSAGLERALEERLRGEDGYRFHLVDNLLRDLGSIPERPPQMPMPGETVSLSLDIDMQAMGEALLEGLRGSLVVMVPETGELLAFVSAPDYVLEPFTGAIPLSLWEQWRDHPHKVLLNRPINGLYPPGSTFKLLAAAIALEDGLIAPTDTLRCDGVYFFGDRNFRCNVWPGHGSVNMQKAIAQSCNIYFYQLIQRIGFDRWEAAISRFGFGQPTGIELGLESTGLVPNRPYMDRKYAKEGWRAGHLLNLVLGQGDILVTPLQIARMIAAIANRGLLVEPTLLHDPERLRGSGPEIEMQDQVWDFLQASMYQVIYGYKGTGFRAAYVQGGRIYGKTGTAENPHGDGHSWFSSYVVSDTGQRAVIILLIEQGGLGSRVATPMAAKVIDYFFNSYIPGREVDLAQLP